MPLGAPLNHWPRCARTPMVVKRGCSARNASRASRTVLSERLRAGVGGEKAQVDAVVGVGGVRMVVGIVGILRAGSGLGVREPLQLVLLSLALLGVDRRSSR